MNEFLIVKLSNKPTQVIPWLVWSQIDKNVIASGEISERASLADLAHYTQSSTLASPGSKQSGNTVRQVIALMPTSQVLISQVQIPTGAARQLDNMLPFLMEDLLTQDIDEMHFSVLNKTADKAVVASMERDVLKAWLDDFKAAGIGLSKILPDALALPFKDDHVSAMPFFSQSEVADQWLLRQGEFKAASVESQWLGLFLSSGWMMPEGDKVALTDLDVEGEMDDSLAAEDVNQQAENGEQAGLIKVDCYGPLPDKSQELPGKWQQADYANLALAQLATQAVASKTNLLTGEFKPQAQWRKHLLTWRKLAIAAGVLFAVTLGQKWMTLNQVQDQYQAYKAENERIFRAALPGRTKIPTVSYLKREMENELAAMSGGESAASAMAWVAKIPAALKTAPSMQVLGVKYDGQRRELSIQAVGDDFQPFEQLRSELAKSFAVEQGQLTRSNDKVFGSYTLTEMGG